MLTYRDLAQRVRSHLGQGHRYAHVVRVARCAELLAKMHRIDTRKARLAGMLHDLARLYSMERLISECEMRQMTIDSFERANPIVLHARLGALLAQETFGVHDPAVLSAIEKHTVGAAAMSPLDCVVYLADGLEPGRDFNGRDRLWQIAEHDLDRAMHATLASTVGYLTKQGLPVAPQTKAAVECFAALTQEVSPSPN
ncbi:MAG: bis(5'-nucleosyl)-tetraphosphatase (symmetrical) YqeK [Candidatus Eremiobacteraeota bacterium]|nr:bis(5'-nucleosyl)-tetraphosphatase (symmetrical) YqeK [Candidatus Eremiobacteraeota bacterium]